jgi:hypothetical protein
VLARLAVFLLLVVPPMALAADAPPDGGKLRVVQQPPAATAAAPAPTPAPPPPLPAAASPVPRDGADCRMDCAQSYYQCRVEDPGGECGGSWSRCLAACNSPNLAPPATTAAP